MARPVQGDFGSFYQHYVNLTTGHNVVALLENSFTDLEAWLKTLEPRDLTFTYAPDKWSLAQLLQHIIDTERVFSYRALCIGRGEQQPLPGFDENAYAKASPAAGRKWKGLAEELLTLRKANIILFRSLEKEGVLGNTGIASGLPITVNALGFIMVGHVLHHQNIVAERYIG